MALQISTRSAGTGASTAGPDADWVTPGNIVSSNNVYSTATGVAGTLTDLLRATNFGFTIPTDAIIHKVTVRIERKTASGTVTDAIVKLLKGAGPTESPSNKASGSSWPTSDAVATYGGTIDDLWGLTLTPTEINASTFGAEISINLPNTIVASIDHIEIEVEYNRPPVGTITSPTHPSIVSTLTPLFGGNYSDLDGDAFTFFQLEVRRISDNALMWDSGEQIGSGTTWAKLYAGTTLVSGIDYRARVRVKDSVSGSNGVFGAWSSWTEFEPFIDQAPTAIIVSPTGNATVGTLTPTLTMNFSDPDNGDIFSAYQIQARRFSDQVSFWDSGEVATSSEQRTAKQAAVVYAGTTLVVTIRYEWRTRVKDAYGLFSPYTAWASFTPQNVPEPPINLTPGSLQNTLTPTVSGTYVQGAGAAEDFFQYEVRQGGILASSALIYQSGDVAANISTGQAYGTNNPSDSPATPPALQWSTVYWIRFRSKDINSAYSEWSGYNFFYTNSPPTATPASPASGAITGDSTPTLTWTYFDPQFDAQTEVEIEVRKVSDDSGVTNYTPKALTQSTQTHDMLTALTAPTEYKWRIRAKGTAGPGFGAWSAYATFTHATGPVLTITDPVTDEVWTTPVQNIGWTFSGGSGTQQDYRVEVRKVNTFPPPYDSGVIAGTAVTHTVPAGYLQNNEFYSVVVTVRDTLSQSAIAIALGITTSWAPPATITGLTVTILED